MDDTTIGGWIWTSNLRPFCECVGVYTGYEFDDDDWAAVTHGVREEEAFEYSFSGDSHVTVWFRPEEGADEVMTVSLLVVRGSNVVATQLKTAMDLLAMYKVSSVR